MKPWTLASGLLLGTSLALGAAGTGLGQQAQEDPGAAQEQMQPGDTMSQEGAAGTDQQMQTGEAMTGAAPMGLDGDAVRELQQALNEAGHDIEVDGIWGEETQSAVRQFQQEQGMEATGEPDEQTLAALGLDPMQIQPGAGTAGEMQGQTDPMQEGGAGTGLETQQDQPAGVQ